MKIVQIRSYFWSVFPVFGLNTGKYGPEITPYLDNFHTVIDTYDRRTNAEFYPQRGALEYCF